MPDSTRLRRHGAKSSGSRAPRACPPADACRLSRCARRRGRCRPPRAAVTGHDVRRAEPDRVGVGVGVGLLRLPLGRVAGPVVRRLPWSPGARPTSSGRPSARRPPAQRRQPAVPGLDRDVGAAGQHVVQVPGALVRRGVDDLGPQVVVGAGQRLAQARDRRRSGRAARWSGSRTGGAGARSGPRAGPTTGRACAGRSTAPGSRPPRPAAPGRCRTAATLPSRPCATASTASRAISR